MSQPPSRSPDSLTGASAEISALQLVEGRGDSGMEGERREGTKREGQGEEEEGRNGRKRWRRKEEGGGCWKEEVSV